MAEQSVPVADGGTPELSPAALEEDLRALAEHAPFDAATAEMLGQAADRLAELEQLRAQRSAVLALADELEREAAELIARLDDPDGVDEDDAYRDAAAQGEAKATARLREALGEESR